MRNRKAFIIAVFLISFLFSKAQETGYPYDVVRYSFIDYKKNELQYYGDSSYSEQFYKKLDALIFEGIGKVNVVHFGGSHVQAGIWPGQIRERMQTFYYGLDGAQGFVFPYRLAKTNTPVNYWIEYTGTWEGCRNVERKKKCNLGVAGISVTTFDSIATFNLFKRTNTKYIDYDFKSFKLFHDFPTSYDIIFDDTNLYYSKQEYPLYGYTEFLFDQHLDTLRIKVYRIDTLNFGFTLHGIILENEDPGIIYNSFGINGASVPSYLRCNMLQDQLAYCYPDLVIFSIGINDAYGRKFDPTHFEHNYDTLIKRVREVAPNAAIILTTNNDSYLYRRYVNRNGEKVRQTMIRLAKKHGAAVWDMYSVMGGLNSIVLWQRNGLAKADKIHFTSKGYTIMGDLFFNAFLKAYDDHLERSIMETHKVMFE